MVLQTNGITQCLHLLFCYFEYLLISLVQVPEENSYNKYAFALVESRNKQEIKLRMYLAGEVRDLNADAIHYSPRLQQVRLLITSTADGDRLFDVTKVMPYLMSCVFVDHAPHYGCFYFLQVNLTSGLLCDIFNNLETSTV